MKLATRICIIVLALPLFVSATAEPVRTETSETGNVYVSGSDISIARAVDADLIAAGGRISIEHGVGADAALAGGNVEVRAPIKQDLRVAAGVVNLYNNIGGDLVAAGGTIKLDSTAAVAGSAWLAGSDVTISGKVNKGARIVANKFTLLGEINGNTKLYAQEINFMPGARINGDLSYSSAKPLAQDDALHVLGTITRMPMHEGWNPEQRQRVRFWFYPLFVLSLLAAGVLFALLFPLTVAGSQRTIAQYPLRSALTGLALLFAVPPAALFLMFTIIGIPIALMLVTLYPLMLLLGYLVAGFFIGRKVADAMKQAPELDFGRQVLFLLIALIILSAASWIPFLGGLVFLAALVMGVGGLAVWLYMQRSAQKTAP